MTFAAYHPPLRNHPQKVDLSIARVTEISATSPKYINNANAKGIQRGSQTLRNMASAWVTEQTVKIDGGKVTEYQGNLMVTFVLDD